MSSHDDPQEAAAGWGAKSQGTARASLGWSAAYLLVSRTSTVLAVPLILGALGSDLYAVWVLSGVLVMSQGLIDLGMGAALVRFVSVGAARRARRAVIPTMRRAGTFYVGLSVVTGLPLALAAEPLVRGLPYIDAHQVPAAAGLVRYAVLAFFLTNVTLVLTASLQGLGRVDAAFRSQALGWLAFVPVLAAGIALEWGVHAIGSAWTISYGLQVLLATEEIRRALASLADEPGVPPGLRDMLRLGGNWQISSWADFATFQLPRLLGGLLLTSPAVVAIDLALRLAQIAVMPIFVALPLVLPRATAAWTRGGETALRGFIGLLWRPAAVTLVVGTAVAVPLAAPAIATWTGRPLSSVDPWLTAVVLVGVGAHASTGVMSAALLATGAIRPVVSYKLQQLVAAAVLVTAGTLAGPFAVGAAIGAALTVPALVFNRQTGNRLNLPRPARLRPGYVALWAAGCLALTAGIVLACGRLGLSPPIMLTAGALAGAGIATVALRACGVRPLATFRLGRTRDAPAAPGASPSLAPKQPG